MKDDKQYEGLRKKGMSKERAAKIANTPRRLGEGRQELGQRHSAARPRARAGRRPQKAAAGRKGGQKSG